jgi:hypothetical protein
MREVIYVIYAENVIYARNVIYGAPSSMARHSSCASRLALPPAAAVLMLTVCSAQKRSR